MFTQNLYKASNRDGSRGEVLASMCENIGVMHLSMLTPWGGGGSAGNGWGFDQEVNVISDE